MRAEGVSGIYFTVKWFLATKGLRTTDSSN